MRLPGPSTQDNVRARHRRFTRIACVALAAFGSTAAATATAQSPSVSSPADGKSRIISVNPFLPLFGYFSGEYEQRIKPNVAWAISGSHVELDDRYTNLDAKLRLYPNDEALNGFNIAASLGIGWVKRDDDDYSCDIVAGFSCPARNDKSFATPSFAIEGGYQWLLGRTKSTAISAGFGAKRYLGGSREEFNGISRVIPTGRLSIGYVF
ncbi:MAG TPA: hypothetical protein VE869_07345 [Gemmatimonas sp.]|nr:hypothetical protein [Gemmatimonas sp.]